MPNDHDVQIVYAQQLADRGQVDQALAIAKAQFTNTPADLNVHQRLAELYIRLKRFSEADQEIQTADAIAKNSQERLFVYFLRGEFYDRQKMYDRPKSSSARRWRSIQTMLPSSTISATCWWITTRSCLRRSR